jgi:hypothetical protein
MLPLQTNTTRRILDQSTSRYLRAEPRTAATP